MPAAGTQRALCLGRRRPFAMIRHISSVPCFRFERAAGTFSPHQAAL